MLAYCCLDYVDRINFKNNQLNIYFSGCNFGCPYCNTPELLEFKEQFFQDIRLIKNKIKNSSSLIESVNFTGGEPTLQGQALVDLAIFSKKHNLKVGLETNGSKPGTIKKLLEKNAFDFITIDLKVPLIENDFEKVTKSKTFFLSSLQIIKDIEETLSFIEKKQDNIDVTIKTLIVPGLIFKKEDILAIGDLIKKLNCRWTLAQFISQGQNIKSPSFRNINPPAENFLVNLRDITQRKFPNLRIDIQVKEEFSDE